MHIVDWENRNGQTLTLNSDEAEGLIKAIKQAQAKDSGGHGNAVLDYSEIDVDILETKI